VGDDVTYENLNVGAGEGSEADRAFHLERYHAAARFARGKVLDAGCGYGYGSQILSATAKKVVGVDRDGEALNYAEGYYRTPDVTFELATFPGWRWRQFSCTVCIEAIEHIEFYREFVGKILYYTWDRVFLTVPIKPTTNEFHVHAFTEDEIRRWFKGSEWQLIFYELQAQQRYLMVCYQKRR